MKKRLVLLITCLLPALACAAEWVPSAPVQMPLAALFYAHSSHEPFINTSKWGGFLDRVSQKWDLWATSAGPYVLPVAGITIAGLFGYLMGYRHGIRENFSKWASGNSSGVPAATTSTAQGSNRTPPTVLLPDRDKDIARVLVKNLEDFFGTECKNANDSITKFLKDFSEDDIKSLYSATTEIPSYSPKYSATHARELKLDEQFSQSRFILALNYLHRASALIDDKNVAGPQVPWNAIRRECGTYLNLQIFGMGTGPLRPGRGTHNTDLHSAHITWPGLCKNPHIDRHKLIEDRSSKLNELISQYFIVGDLSESDALFMNEMYHAKTAQEQKQLLQQLAQSKYGEQQIEKLLTAYDKLDSAIMRQFEGYDPNSSDKGICAGDDWLNRSATQRTYNLFDWQEASSCRTGYRLVLKK